MKKGTKSAKRSASSGRFVLSSSKGEKISAVEGMKLSHRMAVILRETGASGMSGDERRKLIKEQAARRS